MNSRQLHRSLNDITNPTRLAASSASPRLTDHLALSLLLPLTLAFPRPQITVTNGSPQAWTVVCHNVILTALCPADGVPGGCSGEKICPLPSLGCSGTGEIVAIKNGVPSVCTTWCDCQLQPNCLINLVGTVICT